MDLNKFTEKAINVVQATQGLAYNEQNSEITQLHLFYSLINIEDSLVDELLKNMNRRGTKKEIIDIITKIRNKIKNSIIRTTFIIGYPGESDEQFEELCEFIKEYPFDRMGAFTYSKEENTKAYDLNNQIEETVKEERLKKIMDIQKEISLKLNNEKVGNTYKVIVEIYNPLTKEYRGRSYMSAPDNVDGYIYFTSDISHKVGDLVDVKIVEAKNYDLRGVKL